jgi:hypothetical protein
MKHLHATTVAITQGLGTASLALVITVCSAAVVSAQSLASPDPSEEGTIHRPEVISGTLRKPKCPRSARKAGVGAELILEVQVDETGSVTSMGVMRTRSVDHQTCEPVGSLGEVDGDGLTPKHREAFASAAADAILQWKYRPATRNGNPIRVLIVQVVRFCPEDGVMTLH